MRTSQELAALAERMKNDEEPTRSGTSGSPR
jgi:hypothetical protein